MQRVETAEWTGMRARTSEKEFDNFFLEHQEIVMRLALAITRDQDSANDAVQDGFLKVLNRWNRVRQMDAPEAFLKRIVVRCAIAHLKKTSLLADENSEATCETDPSGIAVRHALGALTTDQQVLLALAIGQRWTYAEISAALKIPEGTVASRLHAAKEAFRRKWGDEQ